MRQVPFVILGRQPSAFVHLESLSRVRTAEQIELVALVARGTWAAKAVMGRHDDHACS